ncbi:MAG: DUF1080 domain-containing protein [Ferruginibacter sp.]|nr:DUF1080 domain-containing protein [Cytophagales bacterium]
MNTSNKRLTRLPLVVLSTSLLLAPAIPEAATGTTPSPVAPSFFLSRALGAEVPALAVGPWKVLFDGKSTDAWRGFKKETFPGSWQVEDGTLVLAGKGGGDLITKDQYENYELELEWKIAEGGNSGILYNVVEGPQYGAVYHTGPEMQILDNERHPDAKAGKNGNRTAGSNYDLIPPSKPAKPANEWNKVRLVVNKGHVEHWLNGAKVVDYQLWSPEWEAMVKGSKFASMPDYGKAKKGHIALQDHGDKVWFRNIRIREL